MTDHDKPGADEREVIRRGIMQRYPHVLLASPAIAEVVADAVLDDRHKERRDADRRVEEARAEMRLPNTCQREAGIRWMAERLVEWKIEEDPAFIAAALYRVMMAARDDKDQP